MESDDFVRVDPPKKEPKSDLDELRAEGADDDAAEGAADAPSRKLRRAPAPPPASVPLAASLVPASLVPAPPDPPSPSGSGSFLLLSLIHI